MTRKILAVAAILGGCASVQAPAPVTEPVPAPVTEPAPPTVAEPQPTPTPATTPPIQSAAVASLMDGARIDVAAGRFAHAGATIERALRLEPRNPLLWQELARVRLRQGEYSQAESLAERSNSWAGGDHQLRADNWRLIAQAREARGDTAGARAARESAERQRRAVTSEP